MNYLAHIYLSSGSPEAVLGSMLGDFVKGDDHRLYPQEIAAAIMLHRQIDAFTDAHPIVSRSKRRLDPVHRHTKGIMVDMFYDHFLAADWTRYCETPLAQFTSEVYKVLLHPQEPLPPRLQRMVPFMVSADWLLAYSQIDSVGQALAGLSQRLKVPNHLDDAVSDLRRNYDDLKSDFEEFFPLLQAFVSEISGQAATSAER